MPRNRIVAVASNEDHRRRLRITGVSVIALAALLLIAQAALAHSAFGSMGPSGNWNGCELEYESTHDATSYERGPKRVGVIVQIPTATGVVVHLDVHPRTVA